MLNLIGSTPFARVNKNNVKPHARLHYGSPVIQYHKMPLKVEPLRAEDLEAWVRICYLAYRNTTLGCLWRSEPSPASYSTTAKFRGRELLEHSPDAYYEKVIDTDLDNKLIAVAKWHVYEKERSEEEVKAGFTLPAPFPEECRAAREKFMLGIFENRWEIMGTRPHIILEMLTTHPDHGRRGAGGMLVKWGTDRADDLGLESYLESSAQGRFLYQRHGYQPVREIKCDFSEFEGGYDIHRVSFGSNDEVHALLIFGFLGNGKTTTKDYIG